MNYDFSVYYPQQFVVKPVKVPVSENVLYWHKAGFINVLVQHLPSVKLKIFKTQYVQMYHVIGPYKNSRLSV